MSYTMRELLIREPLSALWLVLASLLAGLTLAGVGLVLSHRIAGPIRVVSHYLTAVGEGRTLPPRALRAGDELQEFYDLFHQTLRRMRERDVAEAYQLQRIYGELRTSTPEGATSALRQLRELSENKLGNLSQLEEIEASVPAESESLKLSAPPPPTRAL